MSFNHSNPYGPQPIRYDFRGNLVDTRKLGTAPRGCFCGACTKDDDPSCWCEGATACAVESGDADWMRAQPDRAAAVRALDWIYTR